MQPNHVLRAWRANKQTIGAWMFIDSPFVAESMAHAGFDWLCLDMQHGLLDYTDIKCMLPAISTTDTIPFVRVPWNEPYEIMKVLDAGAYGVVVPLVNNAEEAARAVAACRYPPKGMRSFGPVRAAMSAGRNYAQEANDEIACIVMIETAEALENLDEIMSTPGVDAVYIGPADLAFALGLPPSGDNDEPIHVEAVNKIFECSRKHNIAAGIQTGSVAYTKRYLDQGFHMVTLGGDSGFMARMARQELKAARQGSDVEKVDPESGFY
ncbi:MAG: 2,4-dihydroxyhept-2-ene-1,7-dioic acid aldolase [Gammaproteobacteria bacterium]|jgi:4-hydroxy-2-oxoheptanedioate aldolase|nr:2,4-dihydroxyhept-2-ene-1,7-dioic acid aldolase [Gammaproteobacteria bacterium]|tara:strand:- start:896 stop:1696 length:801 start_codon:yes stop_codon:yes gene_type:complete